MEFTYDSFIHGNQNIFRCKKCGTATPMFTYVSLTPIPGTRILPVATPWNEIMNNLALFKMVHTICHSENREMQAFNVQQYKLHYDPRRTTP